jgi:transcriptional regulator with XRE-family HTH domain
MGDSASLSEQLQLLLQQFDGKQDALAAALDVAPSTVSRWIRGLTIPQPRHRAAIARLYEESTRRFLSARARALAELCESRDDDDEPA